MLRYLNHFEIKQIVTRRWDLINQDTRNEQCKTGGERKGEVVTPSKILNFQVNSEKLASNYENDVTFYTLCSMFTR